MPLFLSIQVRAYDVEFGGIYYNIITKGNVAEVTSGDNKYSGNVVIPEMISYEGNDYSVSSIGKESFYYCTEPYFCHHPKFCYKYWKWSL